MTTHDGGTAADRNAGPDPNDVAIVGIGLRFPGAHGPQAFWSNLRAGVESVQRFTDAELAARGVPARLLRDPHYVKASPVLAGMDLFDAEFFGFSPKDAAIMDPQHRQFLECAWEALEDAGHPPARFHGPIGVFGGCGMGSYMALNLLTNPALVESVGLFLLRHTGNDKDFLPTRVSYCLDLKGPSISIQTACSTSLVAVHVAAQSLVSGECDMALAGGVTIEIPHAVGYLHREGEILSPDGHCRAFDHRPMGTIFGSGVGIVVLRRLEDARRDGDRIYAVIKGSAVNNDGAGKVGYLAPSVDGLAAVIAEALAIAGVEPDTIDYVEAHGSGTAMGIPIEVAGMRQVFGRTSSRRAYCGLGSVKANIGHLDTAAGVAGLIKTALALHHEQLPPAPDFEAPNPAIPLDDTAFYVVDRLAPWPRGDRPRRAGVTSLGVGGTNAHVVLQEAPEAPSTSTPGRDWQLLCLSARSQGALNDASRQLACHLRAHPGQKLADVAHTLAVGRHAFAHRLVLACRDGSEGAALLDASDPQRVVGGVAGSSPASVALLLPGGGSQYARMGCELYRDEPVFREQIDRGIDAFRRRTARDLRPLWISAADPARAALDLERPSVQLPAIFILEHALVQWWMSMGVRPDALIGHSLGENTAACVAGVFSFEDALGLVTLRGELFERLPAGGMLSVALSAEQLISHLRGGLDIAALNAPNATVVAGEPEALEDLRRRLVEADVETLRIPIPIAAHSRQVEPILPEFLAYLRGLRLHPPRLPFVSNLTGTWITPEQAVDPGYWAEHLRGTVRFADGMRTLLAGPERVLLEVGPGKTLSSLARQQADAAPARGVVASMRHPDESISDTAHLLTAFGRLWACGVPVELEALWRGERRGRVSLPTYAFQHQRYWIEPGAPAPAADTAPVEPARVELLERGFYRPAWKPAESAAESARAHTWLIFVDAAGVGDRLAQRLRARGDSVVTVRESDDNRRLANGDFALAPERGREGYDDLVRDLVAQGLTPDRIVHLWLLTPDERFRPGSNFFHRNQERGFYSVFFLAQALGDEDVKGPLHLTVLGNGMQALDGESLLHPSKATVLGPCRVIPRELPGHTCAAVDLPLPVLPSRFRTRVLRRGLAEHLVDIAEAEALAAPRNVVVAHRKGRRYEQVFEPVALEATAAGGHTRLRERGVYLITGGLGGLGLKVAADLARRVRARLVLVGRSALPPRGAWDDWRRLHGRDDPTSRKIRAVREIEAAGGEVLLASADVTDVEAMRTVLEETRRRFGALHGVVHAAGLLRDAPFLAKTQSDVEQVFAPKVHGTLVLDALLRGADLDFLVLFSSASTVIAPPGQVDYVAANAFLDAYACSSDVLRSAPGRRTVAVDWGIWSGVGMAADALRSGRAAEKPPETERAPVHPLFDSRDDDPSAPLVLRARYSPQTHWLLDEHRTREGFAVLPGAGYLELARAALLEAGEGPSFELRDLLLLLPFQLADGETRDIEVELRPSDEGYAFRVRSRAVVATTEGAAASADAWETHAQARLLLHELPAAAGVPFAEIETRCAPGRSEREGDGLPPAQIDRMRFGPRWWTLRDVRLGAGEVLASLALRADLAADLGHFQLHPALLDTALACGLELPGLVEEAASTGALWVPISFERVRVHAPLTARVRSWARRREADHPSSEVLLFDVVVVRDDGRVSLEVEGFALRRSRLLAPAAWPFAGGPPQPERGALQGPPSPGRSALQRNFERGILPAEGLEALQRILAAPSLPRVVATSLDLDGLRLQVEALSTPTLDTAGASGPAPGDASPGAADGIERTLAGFWQELLGVRSVGPRDDFFQLGGHSLIAVRLFARIKKAYRVEFPISLLFEAPTIERCADAIRRALRDDLGSQRPDGRAPAPRYTHLVPMHPGQGGDRRPFFLVAGMFGNVLNLRHLAGLLGNERRFYGLQALGLYGANRPHETFEEMASDYLVEVLRVQPNGPYLLGGFSGGGLTAYEMARQLRAAGEEVALLAMLDTRLPMAPTLRANERARIHWDRIRNRGPAYLAAWARDRVRWELGRLQKRRATAADATMPASFHSEEIAEAFRRALTRYQVQPQPGVITLFRPKLEVAHLLGPGRSTNAQREFVFHDNGWGEFVARVDVHEVPGDHDSMVLEPNVRVLATRLRQCLRDAESAADAAQKEGASHVATD